jgi:hypothetical protein
MPAAILPLFGLFCFNAGASFMGMLFALTTRDPKLMAVFGLGLLGSVLLGYVTYSVNRISREGR